MSDRAKKDFVVPVWVRVVDWYAAWMTSDGEAFLFDDLPHGEQFVACGATFPARDPNRADQSDRPDLTEGS